MPEILNDGLLPPRMYKGGFTCSEQAVRLVLEQFDIATPATLYYPGSSTDISLIGIDGVHAIHADIDLDDVALEGFRTLDAEAHCVNVNEWQPETPVDIIAFINPSGIDELDVIDRSPVKPNGVILWASWWGPPTTLNACNKLLFSGVIKAESDGSIALDTNDLAEYFSYKEFADLTETERESFIDRLNTYLMQRDVELTIPVEELYAHMMNPKFSNIVFEIGVKLLYKKQGTFFVYNCISDQVESA